MLSYQTDDGLRGYRGSQAEEQRLVAARQELAFVRRDIHDRIYTANAERLAAVAQYNAQKDAADAASLLVGSFLRQFKVGRKSWLEVLNAHREAHEAQLQAVAIKRGYWSANVRMALQGMVWGRLSSRAPQTWLQRDTQ